MRVRLLPAEAKFLRRHASLPPDCSTMLDLPRIALYVGIAATIVLIACLLFLGWANSGSRNISLAVGTLLGAFMLLGTQLAFEL
jgi:hypothetical protein